MNNFKELGLIALTACFVFAGIFTVGGIGLELFGPAGAVFGLIAWVAFLGLVLYIVGVIREHKNS